MTDFPGNRKFENELAFNATRSSGPGGQNVNKVNTRIELRFDVGNSQVLTQPEKDLLFQKLKKKISKEGILILVSQTQRSQLENKEKALEKFYLLIQKALTPVKKRKKTAPSYASRLKRIEDKQKNAAKKARRQSAIEE